MSAIDQLGSFSGLVLKDSLVFVVGWWVSWKLVGLGAPGTTGFTSTRTFIFQLFF